MPQMEESSEPLLPCAGLHPIWGTGRTWDARPSGTPTERKFMDQDSKASASEALGEAVRSIRVAMLTTQQMEGALRSRPMVCAGLDQDALWFVTKEHTPKVAEAQEHQAVNVAFASPEKEAYVSVSGQAQVIHDQKLLQKLWSTELSRWFPQGISDPDLALLRIDIHHVEQWSL